MANLFSAGRRFERARERTFRGEKKARRSMGKIAYLMMRMRDCRLGPLNRWNLGQAVFVPWVAVRGINREENKLAGGRGKNDRSMTGFSTASWMILHEDGTTRQWLGKVRLQRSYPCEARAGRRQNWNWILRDKSKFVSYKLVLQFGFHEWQIVAQIPPSFACKLRDRSNFKGSAQTDRPLCGKTHGIIKSHV